MALVTDIMTGASAPVFTLKRSTVSENPLCFSLVTSVTDSTSSISLSDFVCSSVTQYAEWRDGFNMLLDKNIAHRETAELINNLTDVGVKLALLDITGDGADVPNSAPDLPDLPDWQFHYDEDIVYS